MLAENSRTFSASGHSTTKEPYSEQAHTLFNRGIPLPLMNSIRCLPRLADWYIRPMSYTFSLSVRSLTRVMSQLRGIAWRDPGMESADGPASLPFSSTLGCIIAV